MQRLKTYLAGHMIDPEAFKRVFFALLIMLLASKTSSSVTVTSRASVNFSGDRTRISSAPARRQHARPQGEISKFPAVAAVAASITMSQLVVF